MAEKDATENGSKGRFSPEIEKIFSLVGFAFCVAPMLVGVVVLGWQVYHWLNTGDWTSRSILDVVNWVAMSGEISNPLSQWVQNPTSWLGLWKLLNWLPLSVTTIVISLTILVVVAFDQSYQTRYSR